MKFKINTDIKPDNSSNSEELKQFDHQEVSIEELLIWATTSGCSDLYIKEYDYPYISRFGKVVRIPCVPISRDAWMEFQDVYINNQMNDTYMTTRMLDTAVEVRIPKDNPLYGTNDEYFFRYRASFGFSENARIGTFRMIRPEQPSFKTINYPEQCKSALQEAFSHKTGIIVFTGATGSGKGLEVTTSIPTPSGMKTIKDIKIGDTIFDKNGEITKVMDKYCPNDPINYEVSLSDGSKIKATAGHLWEVVYNNKYIVESTAWLYEHVNDNIFIHRPSSINKELELGDKRFYITDIKEIKGDPNDYYCLAVDSPTHVFLCTESYVPTHNTTTQVAVMNDFTRPGQVLDNKVIIGLEDPIEYTFKSTDSVKFNQKELEKDFHSYELGIKQALREHPNIILVGECRDKPVINATIEAARTGHLVSTSFHASNVGGTIARLSFHLGNDINLIYDLIINLRIIMSQKLVPSDSGYLVDTQYLIFNDDITKRILEIVQSGENISLEIEKIFGESDIIEQGLAKDWTYK